MRGSSYGDCLEVGSYDSVFDSDVKLTGVDADLELKNMIGRL